MREGRRREFAAFGWAGELPDPQDEATFAALAARTGAAGATSRTPALAGAHRELLRAAPRGAGAPAGALDLTARDGARGPGRRGCSSVRRARARRARGASARRADERPVALARRRTATLLLDTAESRASAAPARPGPQPYGPRSAVVRARRRSPLT